MQLRVARLISVPTVRLANAKLMAVGRPSVTGLLKQLDPLRRVSVEQAGRRAMAQFCKP